MTKKCVITLALSILFLLSSLGQTSINQELLEEAWDAQWISHPDGKTNNSGVYLFKKTLPVQALPEEFVIHISADSRYKLYVNDTFAGLGPAVSDLNKWRFETVDIAPFLKPGTNIICVKVWNFGAARPSAFITSGTGLIIQGNSERSKALNTNSSWMVLKDSAYSFKRITDLWAFYAAGPGEIFNGLYHPWDWKSDDVDSHNWVNAVAGEQGQTIKSTGKYGRLPQHCLYPSDIARLEYIPQTFKSVRRTEGLKDADMLISGEKPLLIPKNSKVSILVDHGVLTNAYPMLTYSKGKGSSIKLTYAEGLFYPFTDEGIEYIGNEKGNRNDIEGKKIKGNFDVILCDGGENRKFEPLWWRCFRYVQLDIETKEEELSLSNFHSMFSAYPLEEKGMFRSDNPALEKIWETGWRTQRLCAGETFFDCPYYEQMQYTGDTRVQSLITYFVSGDTALWRRAINDYYDSMYPFGLTQSRYPCSDPQFIPTFSLVWISMLYDYMMHCQDHEFIRSKLPNVISILQWFENHLDESGLPGKLELWTFVDWVNSDGWDSGIPPLADGKGSSVIAMQYLYTLQKADYLFNYFGLTSQQQHYHELGKSLEQVLKLSCWNESRGLFADNPEQKQYSQHANVLAILADVIPENEQHAMINRIVRDSSLAPCSYYFTFYLTEAMKKAHAPELYFKVLTQWEDMLEYGLTTFPENPPQTTRSDCHAWSASPLYFMYSLICGIEPASPGFREINIAPTFGSLSEIQALLPHHMGNISVTLKKNESELQGSIAIPQGMKANLIWNGKQKQLVPGDNSIHME